MGAHFVSDSSSMQTSVLLVASCLASCLATSLALSQSHHYLPWFGYQTVPAYRFPGVDQYHHYYPNNYNNYYNNNNNQHSRLRQHPVAAVPVLPEVTLESSQESPPPPPQPVFSPASDLLLPVISPIQEEEEVGLVTGVVEPIPLSPSLPPAALSVALTISPGSLASKGQLIPHRESQGVLVVEHAQLAGDGSNKTGQPCDDLVSVCVHRTLLQSSPCLGDSLGKMLEGGV